MIKTGLRKLGFGILLFGMAVCCYTASPGADQRYFPGGFNLSNT